MTNKFLYEEVDLEKLGFTLQKAKLEDLARFRVKQSKNFRCALDMIDEAIIEKMDDKDLESVIVDGNNVLTVQDSIKYEKNIEILKQAQAEFIKSNYEVQCVLTVEKAQDKDVLDKLIKLGGKGAKLIKKAVKKVIGKPYLVERAL